MKIRKPIQMIAFIGMLLIAVVFVVYALGFFTTLYDITTGNGGGPAAEVFNAGGEAQRFNKNIMSLAFYGVLLSVILLLLDNHKRKNFFISNMIATLITSVYFIVVAIYVIIKVIYFKSFYMDVNFEFIAILRGVLEVKPDPGVFHTGIVVSALMIIFSIYISVIAILKTKETSERFKARKAIKAVTDL